MVRSRPWRQLDLAAVEPAQKLHVVIAGNGEGDARFDHAP